MTTMMSVLANAHVLSLASIQYRDIGIIFLGRRNTFISRPQAWRNHMISANVSKKDRQTTAHLSTGAIRHSTDDIVSSLQGLSVDHLGALAVSIEHLNGLNT